MSRVVLKVWDLDEGKIAFGSNPSTLQMGENTLDEKHSSAEGIAMKIIRILREAEKAQGKKSLELFQKSEVVFILEDKPSGLVSMTSNPTHGFMLQKLQSGHKLTNAEQLCSKILRLLAFDSIKERSEERIVVN